MKMKTNKRLSVSKKETLAGIAIFLPFLAGFVVFYVAPFLISLCYTMTSGVNELSFVGFKNYKDVFLSKAFRLAVKNTLKFIAIGVPLIMAVSSVVSLLLHKSFKGARWYKTAFLFPLVVPIASTVMVFQVFFAYSGVANSVFKSVGLASVNWLNSDAAFYILVGLYIWKNVGYNIVLLLAGLGGIPNDFYEVSALEGANRFQTFRYITIPLMMPTFFFVFVISIINSFKSFREAYLLSGTLPHTSIYMLQHYMNNNFQNLNYQRLSVAAFLTFLVIFVFIFILFLLRRKSDDYEL